MPSSDSGVPEGSCTKHPSDLKQNERHLSEVVRKTDIKGNHYCFGAKINLPHWVSKYTLRFYTTISPRGREKRKKHISSFAIFNSQKILVRTKLTLRLSCFWRLLPGAPTWQRAHGCKVVGFCHIIVLFAQEQQRWM